MIRDDTHCNKKGLSHLVHFNTGIFVRNGQNETQCVLYTNTVRYAVRPL